jgi:hypothetical protein
MGYIAVDKSDVCAETFLSNLEKLLKKNNVNQEIVETLKSVSKELHTPKYKTFAERLDATNKVLQKAVSNNQKDLYKVWHPKHLFRLSPPYTSEKDLEVAQKLVNVSSKIYFTQIKNETWKLYHDLANHRDDFKILNLYIKELKDFFEISCHIAKKEFKEASKILNAVDTYKNAPISLGKVFANTHLYVTDKITKEYWKKQDSKDWKELSSGIPSIKNASKKEKSSKTKLKI